MQSHPDSIGVFAAAKASILMRWTGDLDQARELLSSTGLSSDLLQINTLLELRRYERDMKGLLADFERPEVKSMLMAGNAFVSGLDMAFGDAHALLGELEDALPYYERTERLLEKEISESRLAHSSYAQPFLYSSLGVVQAYLGKEEEALAAMRRSEQLLPLTRDYLFGVFILTGSARTLTVLGRQDEAIDLLEKMYGTPAGQTNWELRLSPQWDPLRENPRFQELLARDPLAKLRMAN